MKPALITTRPRTPFLPHSCTTDNTDTPVRDTFDINNYLIYSLNDCWALGARFEWYQNEGVYTNVGQQADIYQFTMGLNYRPHANFVFRPEIRHDWQPATGMDATTFGVDAIVTF